MSRNYYYLVTSLPTLRLDDYKEPYRVDEFVQELKDNLSVLHYGWVRDVLSIYDNANIIDVLCADGIRGEHCRGNWTHDELEQLLETPGAFIEELPRDNYLREFFEIYTNEKKQSGESSRRDLEELVSGLYYRQMRAHPNAFIRKYYRFDADLRNVLTALNIRRFSMPKSGFIGIDEDEVITRLRTSSAADFGLSGELTYLGALNEVFARPDLVQVEKFIDQLRWHKIEEINTFNYFEIDVLLGYLVKLMLVERWIRMDRQKGRENLFKLIKTEKEEIYQ